VPPPLEDPPTDDPHPLIGEDVTAEQLFQQQLAGWLHKNQNFGGQGQGHQHVQGQGHQPVQHMIAPVPLIGHDIPEDNVVIVPPRLNTQTLVQGVPFHAGFHPPASNIADSPL
jgi:hypothetical protein